MDSKTIGYGSVTLRFDFMDVSSSSLAKFRQSKDLESERRIASGPDAGSSSAPGFSGYQDGTQKPDLMDDLEDV